MTSDRKPNAEDTAPVATTATADDEVPEADGRQSVGAASQPRDVLARPKTMMGIGASAVVVGSLGKARLPSTPSVETKPMSFEPLRSLPSAVEGQARAPEATFAPSASPSEPFALPHPSAGSDFDPTPLPQRRPTARLLVVLAAVLGAGLLIALMVSLRRHPPSEEQRLVPTATSAATAAPAPPPPVLEPVAPEPATTPAPTKPFNLFAAKRALEATSRSVLACRKEKRWGVALATVTFANDGAVSGVVVGPPFAGTPTGACVAEGLSAAHVPPFAGKPGALVYRFFVAPK
jgi:hypothetical protein